MPKGKKRMKKSTVLIAVFLSMLLTIPTISTVRAGEYIVTVETTDAATNKYSCHNITVVTEDGGKIVYLFIWQGGLNVNWRGIWGRFIFDTPPILQMSKYFKNGTLDCSITHIPLFLLQYNDTNDNGLFDFWTMGHKEFNEEIDEDEIDWGELKDRIYRIYSLAPIFHFWRQLPWSWTVSPIDDTLALDEYSWNISATIPALSWFRAHEGEQTTINVSFGYHVRLLPENPIVKYDFNFSGITWANGMNMKLAMMSAILYHSKEAPYIRVGTQNFYRFSKTEKMRVPWFTISENVTEAVKAFVNYTSDATVDGNDPAPVVNASLQPLFLPLFFDLTRALIPGGVYVRGTTPGMRAVPIWRHYIAFAHQLGLPHFNDYVSQDPVIGLAATLFIAPFLPVDLLPLKAVITAAIIVTVAFTLHSLRRRRITVPIPTSQPKL